MNLNYCNYYCHRRDGSHVEVVEYYMTTFVFGFSLKPNGAFFFQEC